GGELLIGRYDGRRWRNERDVLADANLARVAIDDVERERRLRQRWLLRIFRRQDEIQPEDVVVRMRRRRWRRSGRRRQRRARQRRRRRDGGRHGGRRGGLMLTTRERECANHYR